MNKELETLIQQMAEPYGNHVSANLAYQIGIKDADAIGFIEWYFNSSDFQRFNKGSFRNPFWIRSTEEIYFTYLETKNE